VHIAGTNGKGSVAAYLSALLRHQGQRADGKPLRVGRFTSPHFIDRWDCIQIDDRPIARDVFLKTEKEVKGFAETVEEELRGEARRDGDGDEVSVEQIERDARLTEFEILTATAFTIFSRSDPVPCDVAVIERGLGGRLDATNALPDEAIAVSVITRIGLDHLDLLGGSLRSIVREKCGIVRKDVPVVFDDRMSGDVAGMIQEEIRERFGSKLVESPSDIFKATAGQLHQNHAKLEYARSNESSLDNEGSPPLDLMPHQYANLSLAAAAFMYTGGAGREQYSALSHGDFIALWGNVLQVATRSYPARLQSLQPGWLKDTGTAQEHPLLNNTEVLLDGAHNAQSAKVLREYIDKRVLASTNGSHEKRPRPEIWIIALSSTKPPSEILTTFFPRFDAATQPNLKDLESSYPSPPKTTRIIFTSFGPVDGMPWVRPASTETLLQCANELGLSPSVECPASNIFEALSAVERILAERKGVDRGRDGLDPLIIVAGSLYLCSDFLRLVRDG